MLDAVTKSLMELIAGERYNDAYQHLYKEFHQTLLQFASAYLKAREPAEEIVNDVLYKVWQMKGDITGIGNLRAYLFTAVRNSCLNFLSRQKKEQLLLSSIPCKDMTAEDPESILMSIELYDCIRNAINALPPKCRQIYEMVRIEGMRNKDVSAQLNISVNTIDVQLAIAMKRLVLAVSEFNRQERI